MPQRTDDPTFDIEGRATFVLNVIRAAEAARDDFLPRWEESWMNYLVVPKGEAALRGRTDDPLNRRYGSVFPRRAGHAQLKDPESHQVVESLLAETMTQLFPEDGYVKARPTGGEDFPLAQGTNKIIEHVLGLPRHQRILYQWLKDAFVVGTGVTFGDWDFEEDFEIVRTISEVAGLSVSQFARVLTTIKDDVRLENVDVTDFYPVPGADNFDDLKGAARRVELFGPALLRAAEGATPDHGWDAAKLREAVELGFEGIQKSQENIRTHLDRDESDAPMSEFKPVVGFEYWGEVPWAGTSDDPIENGSRRRRLLVVNGMLVREQDWPLRRARLPFFDITVNPISGRLYGLSPLEVIRFDQDFADVLKQMLARAVVKSVDPPHVYNVHQGVSPAKVAAFRGNVPIGVEGDVRTAFGQAEYNPPISQADSIYQNIVKPQMREAAGAQGGVQGQGLGSKRFSASEAQSQARAQFARPNMIAQFIEKVSLPPLGGWLLDQYAMNIEDNATLTERFGQDFEVTLQDLQPKHDVRFVGGRREHDKLSKASAMERFLAVVQQTPEIRAQIPWTEFLKIYTKAIDLPDLVALIGQDRVLAENTALQAALSQFQDGGRSGTSAPPGAASDVELAGAEVQ
jgi:hypothetical protein